MNQYAFPFLFVSSPLSQTRVGHRSAFITNHVFMRIELDGQPPLNEGSADAIKLVWVMSENSRPVVCSCSLRCSHPEMYLREVCKVRRAGLLLVADTA